MEKIFNHKSFNYYVWTLLGSRVNLQIHFSLQVHFKGTVRPDKISLRVVPLDRPWLGRQPLYVFISTFLMEFKS
jgi:hypothetical protein